jgi:hypothetical protein
MKLNETIWLAVLYVVVNTAARCDVLSVTLRLLQRNPSLLLSLYSIQLQLQLQSSWGVQYVVGVTIFKQTDGSDGR